MAGLRKRSPVLLSGAVESHAVRPFDRVVPLRGHGACGLLFLVSASEPVRPGYAQVLRGDLPLIQKAPEHPKDEGHVRARADGDPLVGQFRRVGEEGVHHDDGGARGLEPERRGIASLGLGGLSSVRGVYLAGGLHGRRRVSPDGEEALEGVSARPVRVGECPPVHELVDEVLPRDGLKAPRSPGTDSSGVKRQGGVGGRHCPLRAPRCSAGLHGQKHPHGRIPTPAPRPPRASAHAGPRAPIRGCGRGRRVGPPARRSSWPEGIWGRPRLRGPVRGRRRSGLDRTGLPNPWDLGTLSSLKRAVSLGQGGAS